MPVKTLKVAARAKAQYGCSTPTYMELKDTVSSGTAHLHWKRRSAKGKLMASISGVDYFTSTHHRCYDMGFCDGNYDKETTLIMRHLKVGRLPPSPPPTHTHTARERGECR